MGDHAEQGSSHSSWKCLSPQGIHCEEGSGAVTRKTSFRRLAGASVHSWGRRSWSMELNFWQEWSRKFHDSTNETVRVMKLEMFKTKISLDYPEQLHHLVNALQIGSYDKVEDINYSTQAPSSLLLNTLVLSHSIRLHVETTHLATDQELSYDYSCPWPSTVSVIWHILSVTVVTWPNLL